MEIPRSLLPHHAAARPSPFEECEPFPERVRQFFCEGEISKGAAFDLACSDNHSTRFPDEPVNRKPCPLVKPATGKKESCSKVVCSSLFHSLPNHIQSVVAPPSCGSVNSCSRSSDVRSSRWGIGPDYGIR